MHESHPLDRLRVDGGQGADWSRTSTDYARHRPGYPASFFQHLRRLGVGLPGQTVLDLGTGVGALALEFASAGARVTGIDIAPGQLAVAAARALAAGLRVDWHLAPAESTGLPSRRFDLVSASQAWLYFDKQQTVPEVLRLLAPGGRLLTCHLCWLPEWDALARASEQVVLRHNPHWTGAHWNGQVPAVPRWLDDAWDCVAHFVYDAPLSFTAESWRGRLRACRGVAATLDDEQVAAFDRDVAGLLAGQGLASFTVLHRIDAHLLAPR